MYVCMYGQSPSQLLRARDMLYELLTHCIPADVILTTLTRELTVSLSNYSTYVCMYACMHVCMYIELSIAVCMHIRTYVCMYSMYVCMYV